MQQMAMGCAAAAREVLPSPVYAAGNYGWCLQQRLMLQAAGGIPHVRQLALQQKGRWDPHR